MVLQFVCLSFCLSVCFLSVCLYVCLFVCLSVSLSVCLSPCLSVVDTKKVNCLKEANLNKNKERLLDSCDLIHNKQLALSTTAAKSKPVILENFLFEKLHGL